MKLTHLCLALSVASVCSAGIDPRNFDTSVKPQENFFLYADGGWIKNNPIPSDHATWGSFQRAS